MVKNCIFYTATPSFSTRIKRVILDLSKSKVLIPLTGKKETILNKLKKKFRAKILTKTRYYLSADKDTLYDGRTFVPVVENLKVEKCENVRYKPTDLRCLFRSYIESNASLRGILGIDGTDQKINLNRVISRNDDQYSEYLDILRSIWDHVPEKSDPESTLKIVLFIIFRRFCELFEVKEKIFIYQNEIEKLYLEKTNLFLYLTVNFDFITQNISYSSHIGRFIKRNSLS